MPSYSLAPKKELTAIRVSNKPIIDGNLNDEVWKGVPKGTDFIQFEPSNGEVSNYKTEAKFIYTDHSIIVGVMMFDANPQSILKELSKRDEINNSDFLSLLIDPFNNGLDAFEFVVTPAGVQWDAKVVKGDEDSSWDAVWNSVAKINELGWSVEMEIPYAALRFPSKNVQLWGMNLIRNIQSVREKTTWNFIDNEEDGWVSQSGVLKGIENVNPPVRLSFTPYFSTYFDKSSYNSSVDVNYRGGMDLKYGINESYTLDMMLVPDFGQVQSDDEILNLSPFEVKFDENRQFFTEATELFDRGEIFYSRRIGGRPVKMYEVDDQLKDNEEITENPIETKIINATKISGRNTKGLGIGVFNAMTKNTYAEINDTITGKGRKVKTQPFSNYNMLVFDQSFKNASYASLFNTNVYIPELDYIANVSGTEFEFRNKERSYSLKGKGIVSQRFENGEADEIGHYHELEFGRIKGKLNWDFYHRMISDKYNPNDMGFLNRNNLINNDLNFYYNNADPIGNILVRYWNLQLNHEARYLPRRFSQFTIYYNANIKFKSHTAIGIYGNIRPIHQYDWDEPRVDGLKLKKGSSAFAGAWISSDYRKAFAFDIRAEYGKRLSNDHLKVFEVEIEPRYRFSDKFVMNYQLEWGRQLNDLGYVDDEEINGKTQVYIGDRNRSYIENKLSGSYIFTNKSSLSLKVRHYWAKAAYNSFHALQSNGDLKATDYNENNDINFNSFNIDMVYSWRFAPGSELAVVWKNTIFNEDDKIAHRFVNNLKETFDATQFNSLSVKVIYYIDYMSLKRKG
ncbi:hypothetical protein BZG02_05645 [Labilibaculum filiforme]|uniref:Uncharacterized protein n=1 Tax=Labilibaculum filiforme TaxID=1940526 RepID=A0A2N3I2K1_9BACT|nr:hypothetical protein BZG02_05645 [Labilibaculum filiforme]